MENPQELKKAILTILAEKGDYATILKHLSSEEKEEKGEKLTKLIEPISAFADILTENSKGAFMEDLTARLDETTKSGLSELTSEIQEAKKGLQKELNSLLTETKSSLLEEHLTRYKKAENTLTSSMMKMCVEVVSAKANEILPTLSKEAKLTQDEIEEIIYQSALSVESQMTEIVGDYVSTASFSVSQIADFRSEVLKLIPQVDPSKFSIDWSQVRGAPSVGGTNTNIVRQLITEAIANIESLPDQTGNSGKFLTTNGTTASWGTPAGSGDMLASVYDPANKAEQVLTIGDVVDEDNMASDSAVLVPTQQSVKAYVDTEIAGVGGGVTESLVIAYATAL